MTRPAVELRMPGGRLRRIGGDAPCFVIAEAGVNHNGRLDLALALVDAAADAGADAVKFQTFRADELASARAPKAAYQRETTAAAESQRDMLRALQLSPADHGALSERCRQRDIHFLSSPFDAESADILADLGVPAFKISSGELTNHGLLAHVAAKRRPIILSTGMASLEEVGVAVEAIRAAGNGDVVLLHCVSNYPADPADVNLRAMDTMARAFGVPVGYSDHTLGLDVALAAVALGASVIEKHVTLDCALPGPDHRASLPAAHLPALVRGIRAVEAALGDGRKAPAASEAPVAAVARRSLVAAVDIPADAVLTAAMVAVRRPGGGLPPALLDQVLGRRARVAIPCDSLLRLEMLA